MRKSLMRFALAGAFMASAVGGAHAQSFPAKPVTIVVPFAAGGAVDGLARAMSTALSERWGQPVIVDNRPGAGTLIGTSSASRAAADGYTLLATTTQTFTTNRFIYKSLPYSPDDSFVPVSMLVKVHPFLLASAAVPANDLKQLVALAREQGSSATYGSWGNGSEPQLIFEQLKAREGLAITHVPYKGVAPVLQALVAGEINVSAASAAAAAPLVNSGKIKPLAVIGSERSPQYPSVPTTAEAGYPYLRTAITTGLFAPAGTPAKVLEKLEKDVRDLLRAPSFVKEHVTARGFDAVGSSRSEAARTLRDEVAQLQELVKVADLKID